jgi:hypothetical protein
MTGKKGAKEADSDDGKSVQVDRAMEKSMWIKMA